MREKEQSAATVTLVLFAGRHEFAQEIQAIIERIWDNSGHFDRFASWLPVIERLNEEATAKQFVIMDYFALWGTGPDLSDYKAFLQEYSLAQANREQRTLLLIVRCMNDPFPEVMFGWGTLVDAYCTLPLDEETSDSLFSRIEAELRAERSADAG